MVDGAGWASIHRVRGGASAGPVLYDRRWIRHSPACAPRTSTGSRCGGPGSVHVTGITPALGQGRGASSSGRWRRPRRCRSTSTIAGDLWSPGEARAFAESVLPAVRYFFIGEAEAADSLRPRRARPKRSAGARRGWRPRRRSRSCRGRRARQCSTADVSGGPADATRCRWSIRLAPATPTWPASCGRRSTGGAAGGGGCRGGGGSAQVLDVGGHRAGGSARRHRSRSPEDPTSVVDSAARLAVIVRQHGGRPHPGWSQ